jgi:riboflavin synthase alpha subunit
VFTGLVAAMGPVLGTANTPQGMELRVELADLPGPVRVGDSVALSGVCCTVAKLERTAATFELSKETLARTWLAGARPGGVLNLEAALRAGEPLGGHLVQGHVDGVGEVVGPIDPEAGGDLWARIPQDLLRYCVAKGSIALDGVSLTIASMQQDRIRLAVIPHTARVTTLGRKRAGDPLHVEVDVLAKYVERMLEPRFRPGSGAAL